MRGVLCVLAVLVGTAAYGEGLRVRSTVVTPVITADAYAQGDQIGTYTELDQMMGGSGLELRNLVVIDQAKVKHDVQVLLFNGLPTLASADNAAVSFTDAVASASFVGRVALAEADYVDTASNSHATKELSFLVPAGTGKRDLYAVLVCVDSGGCDYAAVTDLVLKFTYVE